jgi:NACalpha-BTF3-like transcription factor
MPQNVFNRYTKNNPTASSDRKGDPQPHAQIKAELNHQEDEIQQCGRTQALRRNASSGITLLPRKVMEDTIETVMSFTNCSREDAVGTLAIYDGDILKTLDALFSEASRVGGEICRRRPRWRRDRTKSRRIGVPLAASLRTELTVVFSGAHRKIPEQTPPASAESAASEADRVSQSAP